MAVLLRLEAADSQAKLTVCANLLAYTTAGSPGSACLGGKAGGAHRPGLALIAETLAASSAGSISVFGTL